MDAIQLKFREKNSIIRATLQSRSNEQSVWHNRCQGIFYSLQVDGTDLSNEMFTFSNFRTLDRFWRMVAKIISGSKVTLGGDKALQIPLPPIPWKKWLLWGVLVAGVVLLAAMTWKLAMQMNRTISD